MCDLKILICFVIYFIIKFVLPIKSSHISTAEQHKPDDNEFYFITFFKENSNINRNKLLHTIISVSYTHLDVYKRQALRRFMARRGIPSQLYSDNGTNFRKARNILHDLYNLWHNKDAISSLTSFTSSQVISWSFIPPSSPHFGGLCESGIKSLKFHLRRVVSKSILTFEEFTTVLSQIEACLLYTSRCV